MRRYRKKDQPKTWMDPSLIRGLMFLYIQVDPNRCVRTRDEIDQLDVFISSG